MNKIKKTVGREKPEEPLARAFRLHKMVEELVGKQAPPPGNVRKTVGRKLPKPHRRAGQQGKT